MVCTKSPARAGVAQRSAFTLIELLLIVAILATIAALAAGAILRFITVQQQNNTRTALNKIQAILDRQISATKDQALRESISPLTQQYLAAMQGTDPNYRDRQRVIYTKLKLQQIFPETFAEVFNPAPGMKMASYQNYLAQYGITAATAAGNGTGSAAGQYQYQSAVCLAMALQVGIGSGGVNMDDIGKGGALGTVLVDPSPGITITAPALLDAWGTPICFCRFPAGCPIRNLQGAVASAADPLDPLGTLMSGNWPASCSTCPTTYQQTVLQRLTSNGMSFNLWPIVASAGPDKQFGLWMSPGPNPANPGGSGYFDFSVVSPAANDNLYPES